MRFERSAPLARFWPHLERAIVGLRRHGDAGRELDTAWALATKYGERLRLLHAAAAVVEQVWLTGRDDARLDECVALLATDPVEVRSDLGALPAGLWALVVTFEGSVTVVRFATVDRYAAQPPAATWSPLEGEWSTSLDHAAYVGGVQEIRRRIAAGTVYQVNLCRVMAHPLADDADLDGLAALLARGNPAPHAGRIHVPAAGLDVVCEVDGVVLQQGSTDLLLFDIASILADISVFTRLEPGDVILTGTPAGVGAGRDPQVWLRPGQTVVSRISGVGEIRNRIVGPAEAS